MKARRLRLWTPDEEANVGDQATESPGEEVGQVRLGRRTLLRWMSGLLVTGALASVPEGTGATTLVRSGLAYVFRMKNGALGSGPVDAGHVAWGFEYEPGRFVFGSTDGRQRAYIPAGQDNGAWMKTANLRGMIQTFKEKGYYDCKLRYVETARPAQAYVAGQQSRQAGYNILGSNCITHAWVILRQYNASELPSPGEWIVANHWFEMIGGSWRYVRIAPE